MAIFLFVGVLLAGTAVALTARALVLGSVRRQQTLAQIATYGYANATPDARDKRDNAGFRAALERMATHVGTVVLPRLPDSHERQLRTLLRSAGSYRITVEAFVGYRVLAAVLMPLLLVWLLGSSGGLGARSVLVVLMFGALGWVLPWFLLKRRAAKRLQAIDLEMPELVDLLVTTVEAGVGLAGSLQFVTRRIEGPLGQELRLALQEQSMGLTIEEALENMLVRADSPALRAFVQAILQGQLLGVSLGKILRDLAVDMRKRRRQAAEERAQKAPTKILFPLVVLILPALLIVSLTGPMIGLLRSLGSF